MTLAGVAVGALVMTALTLGMGVAIGRSKPACDAVGRMMTPEDAEGQVVKVEPGRSRFSVRESDGLIHEFQASAETLRDLKVGDRIEVKLWEASRCP